MARLEVADSESKSLLSELEVLMPCDVENQMLGPSGAAYVFGPQKGAKPEDLPTLDENMRATISHYLRAVHPEHTEAEHQAAFAALATTPGTGAAGGLVAAMLACFAKARVVNGMDYVSHLIDLESLIADSAVVCTGEGSFDSQTLEGKVVSKVHALCAKHGKPLYIICGVNKLGQTSFGDKVEVHDLVSNFGLEDSLKRAGDCLRRLMGEKVAERIKSHL